MSETLDSLPSTTVTKQNQGILSWFPVDTTQLPLVMHNYAVCTGAVDVSVGKAPAGCTSLRTWVWIPSTHIKARHGCRCLKPQCSQVEPDGSQGLGHSFLKTGLLSAFGWLYSFTHLSHICPVYCIAGALSKHCGSHASWDRRLLNSCAWLRVPQPFPGCC